MRLRVKVCSVFETEFLLETRLLAHHLSSALSNRDEILRVSVRCLLPLQLGANSQLIQLSLRHHSSDFATPDCASLSRSSCSSFPTRGTTFDSCEICDITGRATVSSFLSMAAIHLDRCSTSPHTLASLSALIGQARTVLLCGNQRQSRLRLVSTLQFPFIL